MKKIFLLLVFNLASLCFVNADGTQRQIDIYNNLDKEFDLGKRCLGYTEIGAVSKEGNTVIIKTWPANYYIKKIDLDNIDKDMYGYCIFEYNARKYLAIYGSNMFFSFDYVSPNISNAYNPGLSIKEAPFAFMQYIKPVMTEKVPNELCIILSVPEPDLKIVSARCQIKVYRNGIIQKRSEPVLIISINNWSYLNHGESITTMNLILI